MTQGRTPTGDLAIERHGNLACALSSMATGASLHDDSSLVATSMLSWRQQCRPRSAVVMSARLVGPGWRTTASGECRTAGRDDRGARSTQRLVNGYNGGKDKRMYICWRRASRATWRSSEMAALRVLCKAWRQGPRCMASAVSYVHHEAASVSEERAH